MSKYSKPRSSRVWPAIVISLAAITAVVSLAAFGVYRITQRSEPAVSGTDIPAPQAQTAVPTEETAEETEPTAPKTVVTADGNSGSILCRASYTSDAPSDAVILNDGGSRLTADQLQVYYLSEISAWKSGAHEQMPDFSAPLENQLCPMGDGKLSWQHYFLQRAIDTWRAVQALGKAAEQPIIIQEEAFSAVDPNPALHETYVSPDAPVVSFLYSDKERYTPNSLHQAWLDGLDGVLETLAERCGYESAGDYIGGVTAETLTQIAKDYNLAYMYLTEFTYSCTVAEEELQSYITAHREELPEGITVDFRHILLIPEGAETADDGTVTASEEAWAECGRRAEYILNTIKAENGYDSFAEQANKLSMDAGTQISGGIYRDISRGQLMEALDEWCFAADRKAGDKTILRTELGYHICEVKAIRERAETEARKALELQKETEHLNTFLSSGSPDYSAVTLWVDPASESFSLPELLYPDIAHERFPEVIVYFQQDFFYAPYGSGTVGKSGCGITTFAMLSTYMTDTVQSPAMMAKRFSRYYSGDGSGTDGGLFLYGAVDMGYFPAQYSPVHNALEIIEPLRNHQMVISLQQGGSFTTGGHYLLIQKYYEDTEKFQVRDSNIYNYREEGGRSFVLANGHRDDAFSLNSIRSGGEHYYIMQQKITRIPACARCGDTFEEHAPELLLREDYCCEKCAAALTRREQFLTLTGLNGT